MFHSFFDKPYFMLQYFVVWAALLWVAIFMLLPSYSGDWLMPVLMISLTLTLRLDAMLLAIIPAILLSPTPLETTLYLVCLLPITVSVGIASAALLHNASHSTLKPRWLNTCVGEVISLLVRTNYFGWKMVHYYHHKHTDDSNKDPHCPQGKAFWPYANNMQKSTVEYLDARHLELHHLPKRIYILTMVLGALLLAGIPLFWLLVFGPTLFAAIWMPIFISAWWLYYVINYYTHPYNEEGGNAAVNLNTKVWHKLMNMVSFGTLYHKNHHEDANLFNPSKKPASEPN
ncbi:fatty acid desaturase [Cycloclasticus pugetii]|uniref:fatty acid desaturase n=1 Tax=Cycloclasticus pugetii TaxID=34068 RepID=UPI00036FD2B5|nr:fatty acid desaturase [Cycloclasticus pugetii]